MALASAARRSHGPLVSVGTRQCWEYGARLASHHDDPYPSILPECQPKSMSEDGALADRAVHITSPFTLYLHNEQNHHTGWVNGRSKTLEQPFDLPYLLLSVYTV